MLDRRLPAVCDFSVTNVCNAACGFCGFARDKTLVGRRQYADADAFARALPILHRRGIRYMTLQGGEPLVHPDILARRKRRRAVTGLRSKPSLAFCRSLRHRQHRMAGNSTFGTRLPGARTARGAAPPRRAARTVRRL